MEIEYDKDFYGHDEDKFLKLLEILRKEEHKNLSLTSLRGKFYGNGITNEIINDMLKFKVIKKIKIKDNFDKIRGYTFKINSLINLNKLLINLPKNIKRVAQSITINKLDSIYFMKIEGNKLRIEIMDNRERKIGYMRNSFKIHFEDEETLDYFIEKTKNEFDKIRPKLRKKTEGIRLKILQIDKALIPLENKARDLI